MDSQWLRVSPWPRSQPLLEKPAVNTCEEDEAQEEEEEEEETPDEGGPEGKWRHLVAVAAERPSTGYVWIWMKGLWTRVIEA